MSEQQLPAVPHTATFSIISVNIAGNITNTTKQEGLAILCNNCEADMVHIQETWADSNNIFLSRNLLNNFSATMSAKSLSLIRKEYRTEKIKTIQQEITDPQEQGKAILAINESRARINGGLLTLLQ